jgi:RNA polymerase sigma factor (sigma-70 family)
MTMETATLMTPHPGLSQTDWGLILEASQGDVGRAAAALERLIRRYWPAVYAYIRATGRDVHEAADLTQGFVCDVVLARKLLKSADPKRGRFRSLLLTALRNYLREQHRHSTRQRRDESRLIEIDIAAADALADDSRREETPESAFAAQWGASLIRHVLEEVRRDCLKNGQEAHWTVFEQRVVRPMLLNEPPAEYAALVVEHGLKSATQAAGMVVTIKRRFARALIVEISRTVDDPRQVEQELRELMRDLEQAT